MADDIPRLYLITPPLAKAPDLPPELREVLEAGDIACLLVKIAAPDAAIARQIVQAVNEIAQPLGCAVLVEGDKNLAVRANADGMHFARGLDPSLGDAIASLQPGRIVGVGGIKGRDDAMTAGEAGVDYLMLGEPTQDGYVPPVGQTIDFVGWWAEIFNVPCVAYARLLGDIPALCKAGADFVAMSGAVWDDPRGPAEAMREAKMLLHPMPAR